VSLQRQIITATKRRRTWRPVCGHHVRLSRPWRCLHRAHIYIFVLNPVSRYDSDSVFIHLTYGFVLSFFRKPMQIEFTSLRKDVFTNFFYV
jgi:hypothetical protein